jgi:hypothetical protein
MATTTATIYRLGFVEADGSVRDALDLGPPSEALSAWCGVRLHRFWPANRPGEANDPWNRRSSVGRDRGAICLRVAPLLRTEGDLDASAIRVFDVCTRAENEGCFPPVGLDTLLPAKVRAGDGLLIQADLVDVSLFTTVDQVIAEAGRIIDRRERPTSQLTVEATDTVALLSEIGGYVLTTLWHGVLHPLGVDARAWDPGAAQFHLYGPSLNAAPQARSGRYLLLGGWAPCAFADLRYDSDRGLLSCEDEPRRIVANVLEFELLQLRER